MPKIRTVKSNIAREKFSQIIIDARYKNEQFIIKRFDQPMAVIIGIKDWQKDIDKRDKSQDKRKKRNEQNY